MKEIPILTAKDVELRVGMIKAGAGCSLLVYKDARVDMRILDEVFGSLNWERKHDTIDGQLFCTVRVWDAEKGQWISKQDVGTESKTEAEKGRASDSFKRACFNLGIGRELYDAPFIWVKLDASEMDGGRLKAKVKFHVKEMVYDKAKGEYTRFVVVDQNGVERFSIGSKGKSDGVKPQETSPESRKQGVEQSEAVTPSVTPQEQIKKVTEAFGGSVQEMKPLVRMYNGKMQINVRDVWRTLAAMDTTQLQWVVNQMCYQEAHNEAFRLLSKR